MNGTRFSPVFPVFVFALAALAFVPNQLGFASTLAGWCVCGGLLVAGLAAAAAFGRVAAFWVVPALTLPVLVSDSGLPGAVGLPFLGLGGLFAAFGAWPKSSGWVRLLALVVMAWLGWAVYGWWAYGIAPAETRMGFIRFFSPDWPEATSWGRLSWPMGNANPMAGLLLMLIPLGVALTLREAKAKLWRTPWAVGTLLAGVLLAATGSRAGLLAPVAAAAGYVLLLPGARLSVRAKGLLFGGGLAALAAFVAASPVYRQRLLHPETQAYSDEVRADFLASGLAMVRDRPWTGVGAGGVPAHYGAYLSASADQPGCHQLHNTPLQWAAEFGVAGGALWLALAALTFVALRRAAVAAEDRVVRGGAAVAAMAYLLFSLLDYQLYLPVTAFAWGACLGLALRGWTGPEVSPPLRRVAVVIALGLAGVAALSVAGGVSARRHSREAARMLAAGRPAEALDALGAAMVAAPHSPVYPAVAATVVAGIPVTDTAARATHLAMADSLMARACENAPDFPYLTSLHGWIWVDADPKRAESLFLQALRRSPKLPDAWQGLARARGLRGDLDGAVTALALHGMIMPEDLFSPALRTGFFSAAAPRVRVRVRELAAAYAREVPGDARGRLRLAGVLRQLDAWADAGERVDRFLALHPDWSASPLWRHLASVDFQKNAAGEYALRSRMIYSALLHAVLSLEAKDGHAMLLLDQASGTGSLFDGHRVLRSREHFGAFGHYLGDASVRLSPLSIAEADLLAHVFVYEGDPVRPHLNAAFFARRAAVVVEKVK